MTKKKISTPPVLRLPHRRATGAGYVRGEETKDKIVKAALDLFCERGYDHTSTRDIAARAGVNAPALQYYFEGKDGLYLACAQYMAARGNEMMAPALSRVRAVLEKKSDTDTLIECVWTLVERAAETMLMSDEVDSWGRFMAWDELRRDKGGKSADAVLEKCFRNETKTMMYELVGRITGRKPDDVQTRIRAVTLRGQITVFFAMRDKVLAEIGWSELNGPRLKILKDILRAQVVAALRSAAKAKS